MNEHKHIVTDSKAEVYFVTPPCWKFYETLDSGLNGRHWVWDKLGTSHLSTLDLSVCLSFLTSTASLKDLCLFVRGTGLMSQC
jgi:hypothetical protein